MNILVIGNGFDLAHGLPTQYTDFLKFVNGLIYFDMQYGSNGCAETNPSEDKSEYSSFMPYYTSLLCQNKYYEELVTLARNNKWISYFNSIVEIRVKEEKTGWIDFESEIASIVQILDESDIIIRNGLDEGEEKVHLEYRQAKVLLPLYRNETYINPQMYSFDNKFIPTLKKSLLDDLDRLIRSLEIYLSDYICTISIKKKYDMIKNLEIDRVLSFNYTNTYQRIYDPDSIAKYDYIHGKAEISNSIASCNMVLGIDEYLPEDRMDTDNRFIQFKKFYQRIFKMTGCKYRDWLEKRREFMRRTPHNVPEKINVYIFGHSLDVTDKDILSELILEPDSKTTIFYHNQNALGSQIANLVKVIGEKELIERTGTARSTIVFKKIE